MAQPLHADDGWGGEILAILMILTLVLPVHQLWNVLSAQGWHPVFKLLACGGVIAAILYALLLMYRHLPVFLSTGLTVAYMAAVYWWGAREFGADPIWVGAITVIAGLGGFFGGRTVARGEHRLHT
jgi:hypothetical protein